MSNLRMPDLNSVIIAGRFTRDPELKYTGSNRAYCKFCIANSRKYKTKEGEQREETVFIEGTVWDKFAEYVATFRKGTPVIAEGRLRQSEWEKDGVKHTRIEIAVNKLAPLEWQDAGSPAATNEPQPQELNDDLPF